MTTTTETLTPAQKAAQTRKLRQAMRAASAKAAPKGTTDRPRHIGLAETNAMIRRALAAQFPGVKFSVKGSSYSGGASTRIEWDGTKADRNAVREVAEKFEAKSFDGMTDSSTILRHYLHANGAIEYATKGGETPADAEVVYLGTDYIFCNPK